MDPILTDKCLRCEEILILDQHGEYNEYHCCSSCTDFIERERYKVLHAVEMGEKAHKEPKVKQFAHKKYLRHVTRMGEF